MHPVSTRNFIIKFPRTTTRSKTVIVSKAVARRAVDRNRIKRITKVALGKIGNQQEGIVLIAKNNIAGLKSQEVYEELKNVLNE